MTPPLIGKSSTEEGDNVEYNKAKEPYSVSTLRAISARKALGPVSPADLRSAEVVVAALDPESGVIRAVARVADFVTKARV